MTIHEVDGPDTLILEEEEKVEEIKEEVKEVVENI